MDMWTLVVLAASLGSVAVGLERAALNDMMYTRFIANPCVTLSTRDGPIGCRSNSDYLVLSQPLLTRLPPIAPPEGVTAKLYSVSSASELDSVLAQASTFAGSPAAILFAPEAISNETLWRAQEAVGVAGIIIADGPLPGAPFSPAQPHPNLSFGLDPSSQHVWNPHGNGWALSNLRKPWFSLGPGDTATFRKRLTDAEAKGANVGVEFKLLMKAASDSATCLRRGWCNWVGGVSLVGSLASPQQLRQAREVVAVVASVDSNGIMQTRAPGAVSDMSGTVALMAAFEALGRAYGNATAKRPSVFHWFSAEAWGYSGSKRFVEQLMKGEAPYNASSVFALLEAKQVGTKSQSAKLQTHAAGSNGDVLRDALAEAASQQHVSVTPFAGGLGLPPSSSQSFLQRLPNTPTVVLTDHGAVYENRFYQSMFDSFENADMQMVCNAASVLAEAVATLQEYPVKMPISVNCSLATELLSCFSHDWRCPLFVRYLPFMQQAPEFPSNYAGVFQGQSNMKLPIKLLHDMVTEINTPFVVPDKLCGRNADCFNNVDLYSCIRGACVDKTYTRYWDAVTPVLFNYSRASDVSLPFFTESDWSDVSMRLMEVDSPVAQVITFVAGLFVTSVATVASMWVARRVLL